jgi:hypothetical protein
VLAHRLFITAEQVGNIRDRHLPLQENARERVPETVRRGGLFNGPATLRALAIRRRQMFVTISRRSDRPVMKGRLPKRSARACNRSRSQRKQ